VYELETFFPKEFNVLEHENELVFSSLDLFQLPPLPSGTQVIAQVKSGFP
jgi:hypothetical protein